MGGQSLESGDHLWWAVERSRQTSGNKKENSTACLQNCGQSILALVRHLYAYLIKALPCGALLFLRSHFWLGWRADQKFSPAWWKHLRQSI